ncbi:MAG: hypothetical protein RL038_811 [Actinomycetota bacterium]
MVIGKADPGVADRVHRFWLNLFSKHVGRLRQKPAVSIRNVNYRRLGALTLALIVTLPLSALAADWQWNRHNERTERNELIATNRERNLPLTDVLKMNAAQINANQFARVTVQGEFIANSQIFWRRQVLNGQPGFIALAKFSTAEADLVVARGWVAAAGSIPDPNLDLSLPTTAQAFETRIRINPAAEIDPNDMPEGQTNSVGTQSDLAFYLEMTDADDPLLTLPDPTLEAGPHLGYVGQWILIGLTGVVAYVMILRRGYASETKSA